MRNLTSKSSEMKKKKRLEIAGVTGGDEPEAEAKSTE